MPTKIEKDSVTGRDTTGHEWDGIKELNTPLPKWWLWTFYVCIAFAAVWVLLYPALPFWGATGVTGWTARGGRWPIPGWRSPIPCRRSSPAARWRAWHRR